MNLSHLIWSDLIWSALICSGLMRPRSSLCVIRVITWTTVQGHRDTVYGILPFCDIRFRPPFAEDVPVAVVPLPCSECKLLPPLGFTRYFFIIFPCGRRWKHPLLPRKIPPLPWRLPYTFMKKTTMCKILPHTLAGDVTVASWCSSLLSCMFAHQRRGCGGS